MEATKNPSSDNQALPVLCPTGCGFFGNPTFENYCSQCYRQRQQGSSMISEKVDAPAQPQVLTDTSMLAPTTPQELEKAVSQSLSPTLSTAPTTTDASLGEDEDDVESPEVADKANQTDPASVDPSRAGTPAVEQPTPAPEQPPRPVQKSKSKCFLCRAKIPLAMQITNQCRCEYVFCNTHKHPDQHDCDFEYKSQARAVLAKNNPKLDENKGGRSFNRLT